MNAVVQAFAFVDIAGFSAYTREHGDEAAARLAVGVADRVRSLLPGHGAEEVKSLGDGLMIRADSAAAAVRLGTRIAGEVDAGALPPLRVGVEIGPAITHEGDYFGAAVNRAARLCAAARPGEVLVTETVREVANADGVAFRRRLRRVRDLDCKTRVYAATDGASAGRLARALRALDGALCPRRALTARGAR